MDKYEKVKSVGKGAFGKVFLCRRISDKKCVIIKQIPVDDMSQVEIEASLNEAEVLKRFHHSNIIQYYENFISNKEYLIIVMEYAPGGTLSQYLMERDGELLAEAQILHLFAQILLALHHVHSQNILHRDLKTANILLDGSKNIVKLGDFGISIALSTRSKAMTVIGTPCYLSPEQCEGKPYNNKSDIWALGCILYEMATLRKAFDADTLPALILKIIHGIDDPVDWHYSTEIWMLIKNLLTIDPAARMSTDVILAQPALINAVTDLYTDIGRLPCRTLCSSRTNLVETS